MNLQEKIRDIEEEIRKTSYHKGTQRHIGNLRARLAKLQNQLYKGQGKGGLEAGFAVSKIGNATVVLVGPPSVGKSTLLNALTNAQSPVAEYEFTTLKVIPGMLIYNNAHIQILDIPGLVTGAAKGRGRGRQVLSVARIADLIILLTDVERIGLLGKMEDELREAGVDIERVPILKIVNKVDLTPGDLLRKTPGVKWISAKEEVGLKELKEQIWKGLGLIRVYLRNRGRKESEPLILKKGATVFEAAEKISSQMASEIQGARIWGAGAKYPKQEVSLKHNLSDGASVTFY